MPRKNRANPIVNCMRSHACWRHTTICYPAWLSRVSNEEVRARAGHPAASQLLLRRQLQLFGKVLRSAPSGPLQSSSFIDGTTTPVTDMQTRRVGRPCKWGDTCIRHIKRLEQAGCLLICNVYVKIQLIKHKSMYWRQAVPLPLTPFKWIPDDQNSMFPIF